MKRAEVEDSPDFTSKHGRSFLKYGNNFRYQFEDIQKGMPYKDLAKKLNTDIRVIHGIKSNIC